MSDYSLTLFEACEFLNRSKKSIGRYIRRGLLHPQQIKSQQGTLEYRFSRDDLEAFKLQEAQNKTRQDILKTERVKNKEVLDQTGQDSEVITLLKETTGILKEQLQKKDEQIKDLGGKIDQLIERNRETNILLKGLQDKVLMLEKPKGTISSEGKQAKTPERRGFWQSIFK